MRVRPVAEIIEYLTPIAKEVGVEIADAAWDMRTRSLTVFIDAEGGVDMDLCVKFHNAIDAPLDELDPTFGEPYTLNCSSLGLDRPFKTERDYLKHLGEKVEVHLYAPMGGKKYYEGELLSYDGENKTVTVRTGKGEIQFPLSGVSKVCLYIEV